MACAASFLKHHTLIIHFGIVHFKNEETLFILRGWDCLNGLGQGPPVASSRGLSIFIQRLMLLVLIIGLGQGLPMASSRGAGYLNFNVENACSKFFGQDLWLAGVVMAIFI